MKKLLILIGIVIIAITENLNAQRVIWEDDFETSKGWSEYEDLTAKVIVKDGVLLIKSKSDSYRYISKCKTSLDANKSFNLTAEINVKRGLNLNSMVGIMFDYKDTKNYTAFYIQNGFAVFEQVKDGTLIRQDKDSIKRNKASFLRNKKDMKFTFEIQKKGSSAMFLVNEEETIDMDEIEMKSNRIAFFVSGNQEATFDNVKITQ